MKKIVFIIVALALLGGVLMYVKHQRDVPRAASKEEARQTAAAAPPSQQSPPSDRGKRADEGVKMNIDLAKGSKLKDLAALVDKDYPDYALNIPDELQDAEISELKLHDAAMSDLAKALDMMGDGRFSTTYSYNHTLFIQPIQPIQPVGAPPHIVDPNRPDINIDLPDSSTLGDLIEVLKTKYPQYGFHLQSEKFKELKIGAFKVKGDSLQKLISDLITVGSPRFIATSPDGWNVFFLGGGYGIIKVFNLGPWLGDTQGEERSKKVQDLEDTIKKGQLSGNGGDLIAPTMKYVPEANVYIVIGTMQQVANVSQIMGVLSPKVVSSE